MTWCSSCRSMSPSSVLAPMRNRSGRSQSSPSSSFIRTSQSSDCLAVRMPPGRLEAHIVAGALAVLADRAHHDRLTGSVAFRLFAGGGLDEVGAGHHADQAGPGHIAQRAEFAGGQDRLQVRLAAGRAERADLVVERAPVAGERMAAGDDDVDLLRAGRHRGLDLLHAQLEGVEPGGEAGRDGRDRDTGAAQRLDGAWAPSCGRRTPRRRGSVPAPGRARGGYPRAPAGGPWRTGAARCPACRRRRAW